MTCNLKVQVIFRDVCAEHAVKTLLGVNLHNLHFYILIPMLYGFGPAPSCRALGLVKMGWVKMGWVKSQKKRVNNSSDICELPNFALSSSNALCNRCTYGSGPVVKRSS